MEMVSKLIDTDLFNSILKAFPFFVILFISVCRNKERRERVLFSLVGIFGMGGIFSLSFSGA